MNVQPRHAPEELAALIRAEPRAKVARRLAAVRLALLGHGAAAIGEQALLSQRQVRTWIGRYNQGGAVALADRAGRGRKGPLTAEQQGRLEGRLRAGATPADGVCSLRGRDARAILRRELGALRSLDAVYALMHRLGFEPLRPRPRHPKGGEAARGAFKKSSRR